MAIDDQTLMAFADGELGGAEAERVAAAVAADPALADQVARHRALRSGLAGAFDPIANEAPPAHFEALVRDGPAAEVIDFSTLKRPSPPVPLLGRLSAVAASLALGLLVGYLATPHGMVGGSMVARGKLAGALERQLASDDPAALGSPVRIGLTFRDRQGDYCRSFTAAGKGAMSGVACRVDGRWDVQLAVAAAPAAEYRPAGGDQALADAVGDMISGDALDGARERAARDAAWTR